MTTGTRATGGRGPRSVGLRVRLTAAFTAVALFAALLASGISYVLLRRLMLQRAQDAVLTEVRDTLARQIPPQLPPDVDELVRAQLVEALSGAGRRAAAVPVPLSGPVPLPDPSQLDVPVTRAFADRARDGLVFQRIIRGGKPYLLVGARATGYQTTVDEPWRTTPPMVFVSASLSREAADLRLFTRALLVADAVALVAALGLALLATGGVLRPVRRLGAAARALGAGELETRVAVRGGDELADLARTFNATAEALERTVTELRAMEAASRRFVADVSHELRTPLTSMVAMTDLLAEEAAAAGGGTAARLVAGETRRLGQLVEHLIEISRFDAGAAALVLDDVNVADAVAATLRARGWRDEVVVDGPPDLFARLDPRRFDVIVANLAGNALKHGRPPVALRFGRAGRDGAAGVEVVVSDHGPGLPGDLLAVVFDRFVKSEAARSRSEGSGLGLSIARENAVLHGGSLDAANAPDGGAVFTLWLPEKQDDEEMDEEKRDDVEQDDVERDGAS
ncbi:sensor histidine kinase [Actinomadura decatromicini]|uniref:histidine kinase n=1 Tax=Actinomadura decatromicini TaxID=2604572 RepID=A0A5D3FIS4_9ACTN|nr:HAMP domain-containing sensor histidine kinase [Actinomadura decatromicini]TYK48059.1 HAMP domain-containing histidine kinase [Actinomadura decatromicini]